MTTCNTTWTDRRTHRCLLTAEHEGVHQCGFDNAEYDDEYAA